MTYFLQFHITAFYYLKPMSAVKSGKHSGIFIYMVLTFPLKFLPFFSARINLEELFANDCFP